MLKDLFISRKKKKLIILLNIIFSLFLVLAQSILLAWTGVTFMYWIRSFCSYLILFCISAAAPIGIAGIWYYFSKYRFKKMFLFYLIPALVYIISISLWMAQESRLTRNFQMEQQKK